MLLDMNTIIDSSGKRPFLGVIHVGCDVGNEAKEYAEAGIRYALWIEANSDIMRELYDNTKFVVLRSQYLNASLSDVDNIPSLLSITNKLEYSSLLPVKILTQIDPTVLTVKKVPTNVRRFESLYREHNTEIDLSRFDLLRVSTNGTELKVLKGFGRLFNVFPIRAVTVQYDDEELFEGSCTLQELDDLLNEYGFTRTLTTSANNIRGEALYTR